MRQIIVKYVDSDGRWSLLPFPARKAARKAVRASQRHSEADEAWHALAKRGIIQDDAFESWYLRQTEKQLEPDEDW